MSTRFEVIKNGERVCISGIDGDGVLSFTLNSVKQANEKRMHGMGMGALGMFDGSQTKPHHAMWPTPELTTGDEITIRVLPEGVFDAPEDIINHPEKTTEDPELGVLTYFMDAWMAEIDFDLVTARIRIQANEAGPSPQQRALLNELMDRYTTLWPDISAMLVRCHTSIETIEALFEQISSTISIQLYRGSNTIEISYTMDDAPNYCAYVVKLRGWEIVEFFTVE